MLDFISVVCVFCQPDPDFTVAFQLCSYSSSCAGLARKKRYKGQGGLGMYLVPICKQCWWNTEQGSAATQACAGWLN